VLHHWGLAFPTSSVLANAVIVGEDELLSVAFAWWQHDDGLIVRDDGVPIAK
jgi:hypothetical protein